ncbi:MAG: antibiotic biosynthesis monooxygenase [Pyrinomonadaceae bacterium]
MFEIASTPPPPSYAVIFTTIKSDDLAGYDEMNKRIFELPQQQPGYLGIESGRGEHLGVSVTYWATLDDIAAWKDHAEHKLAQEKGYSQWYKAFATRVAKVERNNFFERE